MNQTKRFLDLLSQELAAAALAACLLAAPAFADNPHGRGDHFVPVTNYDVAGEVAEIVTATPDGKTLIYTDSVGERLGLVDISDLEALSESSIPLDGEPTSVAVTPDGQWAVVVVHDGEDIIDLDGDPETPPDSIEPERDYLLAVNLSDMSQVLHPLGGQPDSIAISADGRYAAICIENERDEEVNDGLMPQEPPGFLTIVDLVGPPAAWTTRNVSLLGLAERFPNDPEPEFVDINADNVAAVTLQENNHIVIVDLPTGTVVNHFSAGTTTHLADLKDDDVVNFRDVLRRARLEPDAIVWTPLGNLITANEGDYDLDLADGEFVGGRNWTIFAADGQQLFDSGASLERAAGEAGLYPDGRSDAKGSEIEGAEIGVFSGDTYAFIGAERGNFVGVYRLKANDRQQTFVQVLATGDRPEGLLAIPSRNLFVTANEGDGTLSIFELIEAGNE